MGSSAKFDNRRLKAKVRRPKRLNGLRRAAAIRTWKSAPAEAATRQKLARRLVPLVAAAFAPLLAAHHANAAAVFTLEGNGTGPLQSVGVNFTPYLLGGSMCQSGNTCVPVNYSAQLTPQSTLEGATNLDAAIRNSTDSQIVAMGLSQGASVLYVWIDDHYQDPTEPGPAKLSFVSIGNPLNKYSGFPQWLLLDVPPGTPQGLPANEPYKVTEVIGQYDGYSDFPTVTTSPYYGLAVLNALAGIVTVHILGYFNASLNNPADVKLQEGNVTYVWIPTDTLPLISWTGSLAPALDAALRPLIESAYNRPVQIPAPTPGTATSSVTNIPVNLMADIANIPASQIKAIHDLSNALYFTANWSVGSPTNIWGTDPADTNNAMPWADTTVKVDPTAPIASYISHLMSPPAGVTTVSPAGVSTALTNLFNALVVDSNPFVPGSPFFPTIATCQQCTGGTPTAIPSLTPSSGQALTVNTAPVAQGGVVKEVATRIDVGSSSVPHDVHAGAGSAPHPPATVIRVSDIRSQMAPSKAGQRLNSASAPIATPEAVAASTNGDHLGSTLSKVGNNKATNSTATSGHQG